MEGLFLPQKGNQKHPDIQEVRAAFDLWRAARKKKGPFPKELWSSAVSLCKRYTLSEVCQELRLSYSDLKKRVKSQNDLLLQPSMPEVTFFDLTNSSSGKSLSGESECYLEIKDTEGFSLKLQCRGELGVDVVSLCRILKGIR